MRYFTLINNAGETLDITTKDYFFHEIGGLGFEEDNDFRQIGEIWWLNNSKFKQAEVTGKMLFTEHGGIDPYKKYWNFHSFIAKAPLILVYYPYGLGDESYRRRVRVSKLLKSEKDTYGVIESEIVFVCYTPWYKIVEAEYIGEEAPFAGGWVWGESEQVPRLTFEPANDHALSRPARFRYEAPTYLSAISDTDQNCPVKLMIFGPIINPSWSHSYKANESFVSAGSGGFVTPAGSTPIEIDDDEILVIDNTDGRYAMEIIGLDGSFKQNVYQLRDFDRECFITLKEGENRIAVTASGGETAKHIKMEGHLYHATV